MGWKAGRSDNLAHFRFCPGAHGGTVTAVDDAACELIDPNFDRPLRPVAPVAQLDFDEPAPAPVESATTEAKSEPTRSRRGKPAGTGVGRRAAGCALQRPTLTGVGPAIH